LPVPPPDSISVNGRPYRPPTRPTAVVCLDGSDPRYVDDALERGLMPRLADVLDNGGSYALGRAQLPSFTNPNNMSIVTGVPPAVHGIPGNHVLGADGVEVQLTDPLSLRAVTIHQALRRAGVPVACVTTKDKLRRLLSAGGVPCVSAERAHEQALPELGLPSPVRLVGRRNPGIYDPDCSIYALEVGLAIGVRLGGPCLVYVSLTDYVQHAEPPGGPAADRLYAQIDELLARYLEAGFALGLVADHGMNAKTDAHGRPNVRYLADRLDDAGVEGHHVILPITDPYVVHHAALGSAAWVHVPERGRERARRALAALDGVEEVLDRDRAGAELALPTDLIGDLVVLADARTALGRREAEHDLSQLHGPLRSHGGRHEQPIPVIVTHPLTMRHAESLARGVTNADVHDLVLNGLA
jgi:phosphonoacetate hydrolase